MIGQERDRSEKLARIGMGWRREQRLGVALFHQLSMPHDRDPVAKVMDYRQVMADEQDGDAEFLPQIHQQIEHMRLDGNVKRRDRLIAHQNLRLQRQGACDGCALSLTAGQICRLAAKQRLIKPRFGKEIACAGLAIRAGTDPVDIERQPHLRQ